MDSNKRRHLEKLSNSAGIIAALAMDQRSNLRKSFAAVKQCKLEQIGSEMMQEFKTLVSRVLSPHASAILLDPEYGLEAAQLRSPACGLLLAYELSGYDNTRPGRLPDFIANVSVRRVRDWGADAVKVLLYYSPDETAEINDVKHAAMERIGAECQFYGLPFFLELLAYDPEGSDEKGEDFARKKPGAVIRSMQEFSREFYHVDVLKVEVPVNPKFVEGSVSYSGHAAYSRAEALRLFKEASDATALPFLYLSAGVSNAQFTELLLMAAEAGARYSGVLCGRATWKDGINIYVEQGTAALEEWLSTQGTANIAAVNAAVKQATPWHSRGGHAVNA